MAHCTYKTAGWGQVGSVFVTQLGGRADRLVHLPNRWGGRTCAHAEQLDGVGGKGQCISHTAGLHRERGNEGTASVEAHSLLQ